MDTCTRCKGSGCEPEPTRYDIDVAMYTNSLPIGCYDCHGFGEVKDPDEEWP